MKAALLTKGTFFQIYNPQ